MSILDWKLQSAPFAVVDCETTGIDATRDRVIEVSVVHVDPKSGQVRVALDTLVDPGRPVGAQCIHGLSDDDLRGAPQFSDVAGHVADAISGRVLVAHNAPFDLRFLESEFRLSGFTFPYLPRVCTMSLRPVLGLGQRCRLEDACNEYGIPRGRVHAAADDSMATAHLYLHYLREAKRKRIRTFSCLAGEATLKGRRKLADSWTNPLLPSGLGLPRSTRLRARGRQTPVPDPVTEYAHAVHAALSDFHVSQEELQHLDLVKESARLPAGRVRAVHASIFTWLLTAYSADGVIDEAEQDYLSRALDCLRILGWAPGD